ncbi:nuclear pore complex component-domain-containing protein [Coniella lustricola]|uniref:Nuclear pore complex component-domain-containing protein n=1 Tax=Coniella lustricola TaxID=2025994 RepID=A0A2T3A0K3_9PEZI|nr:nuclear pore complex component-domain-containing protein [Coniella lustricola]
MAVTPYKTPSAKSMPQTIESPGNWQHPRIEEITRRQNATVFTSDNVKTIVYNIAALFVVRFLQRINDDFGPRTLHTPDTRPAVWWAFCVVYMLPALNIVIACLPLVRRKDDLSDIPLTPAQRQLLNLPPSSKAPTPDAVYSTPPRYSRTPSIRSSTSKLGGNDSQSNYEIMFVGSSSYGGSINSATASPLLAYNRQQPPNPFKPRHAIQTSSLSPATAKLLNQSTASFASSIFSRTPASPSPAGGKTISVGLNNKWLYERGRNSSKNVWP